MAESGDVLNTKNLSLKKMTDTIHNLLLFQKLIEIETPVLTIPFDIVFQNGKYVMKLGIPQSEDGKRFISYIRFLENYIERELCLPVNPCIYTPADPKYPPNMQAKFVFRNNRCFTEIYQSNGERGIMSHVRARSHCRADIELSYIWTTDSKCGIVWSVKKLYLL